MPIPPASQGISKKISLNKFLPVDDAVVIDRGCYRPVFSGKKGNMNWVNAEDFCVNKMKGILAEFETPEEKDQVTFTFD